MRINIVLRPRPEKRTVIPLKPPPELADDLAAVRQWAMAEAMKLGPTVERLELTDDEAANVLELWLARQGTWLRERRLTPRFERLPPS